MNENRIEFILHFWFGTLKNDSDFPVSKAKKWFQSGVKLDPVIKAKFKKDLEKARAGKYHSWQKSPHGCLALLILLDQFSRHIYRDKPESFKQDKKALAICVKGLKNRFDQKLRPVERAFFYMPLQHSESLAIQRKSLYYFSKLVTDSPVSIELPMANAYDYAKQHHVIIKRFGRFPHRNNILGRRSSPEEIKFLKQPGSSF